MCESAAVHSGIRICPHFFVFKFKWYKKIIYWQIKKYSHVSQRKRERTQLAKMRKEKFLKCLYKALGRRTKKIGERFPYPTFLFAETKRWGRGNVFARFVSPLYNGLNSSFG